MCKNKIIKIIITIISPIFSFLGVSLFNMPTEFFAIVMILLIIFAICNFVKFCLILIRIKDISQKMRRMAQEVSFLISVKDIVRQKKKYRKKKTIRSKLYKDRKKVFSDFITFVTIAVLFWLPRFEPVKILANQIFNGEFIHFTESNKQEEKENKQPISNKQEEKENKQPISNKQEENKQPISNKQEEMIRFTIEYPNGHPLIKKKEFEKLYNRLFYDSENDLNEIIKSNIKIWLNSCKANITLDTAVTSTGKSTEYYSNIEKGFTNENGMRLSSNLLDEVISGRRELFDLYPNGTLAWLLANHMQTYAFNYLNQTSAVKSILFFYMKSIEYTQKSLEFEMDNEIKYEHMRYLHARYKDIAECGKIDNDIRLRAYEIYIAIQETFDELGIPQ